MSQVPNSSAQMASLLEDTQESLAAALARVEALRTREKTLLAENQKLKRRLSAPATDEAAEDALLDNIQLEEAAEPLDATGEAQLPQQGQEAAVQHFPVVLYTNRGKVALLLLLGLVPPPGWGWKGPVSFLRG